VYWKDLIKENEKFDKIKRKKLQRIDNSAGFIEIDQNQVQLHLKHSAFIDYTHLSFPFVALSS
jgi:hypothetical protein